MKMNRENFINMLNNYYSTSPPVRFVLAVDFDGTLCNSNYPNLGDEIKPVCDFIRSISDLDCNIVLYTCRHNKALDAAIEWCFEHKIYFDYVNENADDRILYYGNCEKLSYDLLIDDKALNFNIEDFT